VDNCTVNEESYSGGEPPLVLKLARLQSEVPKPPAKKLSEGSDSIPSSVQQIVQQVVPCKIFKVHRNARRDVLIVGASIAEPAPQQQSIENDD
jgi:hypothetical protein